MDFAAFKDIDDFLRFGDGNKDYTVGYLLRPEIWSQEYIGETNPIKDENNWSDEIKYLNDRGEVSQGISMLPSNTGGVYMFLLKGINLPFAEKYILYIGRAQLTSKMNIRIRAKSYLKDDRIKIQTMFKLWGKDLYYRYYSDSNNANIVQNEANLIRAILPPFNSDLPQRINCRPEINAFEYENTSN